MGGLGGAELLIIGVVVILLFGPSLAAFWIGFTLGRKTTAEKPAEPDAPIPADQREEMSPRRNAEETESREPEDE